MNIPEGVKAFAKAALNGIFSPALLQCEQPCNHPMSSVIDYKTKSVITCCRNKGCNYTEIRSLKELG